MTKADQTPLVHTRDGAILGVDWRRVGRMIPGRLEARHLCPGDRIEASGVEVTVQALPVRSALQGLVHLQTVTDGGAEIAVERGLHETVWVFSAGAFDR